MTNNNNEIKHTQANEIINIIRNTLSYIDPRLVDHGERVAYIANGIVTYAPEHYADIDGKKFFLLCLLHDIGAYKTEEIDNMVMFETKNVEQHAIYGYLFLENTTPLKEYAEAILYHHTDNSVLQKAETDFKRYAQLIFLADRADILLAGSGEPSFERFRRDVPARFMPELVEDLIGANKNNALANAVKDGSYRKTVDMLIASSDMSAEDAMQYMKMIVFTIDFRSLYTVTHTIDMAAISMLLAEVLGVDGEEREKLYLGSFLHDIGKIAVPYSILEKNDRLTPEEMEIIKRHVTYTREILAPVTEKHVCDIASNHHEKMNGTGYPQALTGEELSLSERIAAVADVTSALVNKRSYKEPFNKKKTLDIVKSMRDDGELCPVVCDALIDNFDDIMKTVRDNSTNAAVLYKKIYSGYELLLSGLSVRA